MNRKNSNLRRKLGFVFDLVLAAAVGLALVAFIVAIKTLFELPWIW